MGSPKPETRLTGAYSNSKLSQTTLDSKACYSLVSPVVGEDKRFPQSLDNSVILWCQLLQHLRLLIFYRRVLWQNKACSVSWLSSLFDLLSSFSGGAPCPKFLTSEAMIGQGHPPKKVQWKISGARFPFSLSYVVLHVEEGPWAPC